MGKRDKKKKEKKGKGAEKTAAKTLKNQAQKIKKQIVKLGEEEVDKMIARIEAQDAARSKVVEEVLPAGPSHRANFTLTAHPDKDELVMFGGEFFNGQKTELYNDLVVYNVGRKEWKKVTAPKAPPPRCSHQAVMVASGTGAQLWVCGGEFSSPSQAQFHHYKDLWVFHLQDKKWEKIIAPGGPSPRSGHRMVCVRKHLVVFGGFHDNLLDYRYHNDVHAFDLDSRKWKKLEVSGTPPSPRSGCQMAAMPDGKIVIYGGYMKEKMGKDADRGHTYTDMFVLTPEKSDQTLSKWKWGSLKQTGIRPPPRCGFSLATAPGNSRSYMFGGVWDEEEDEESIKGKFLNDLHILELDRGAWISVNLSGKKDKKQRRKGKGDGDDAAEEMEDMTIDAPEVPPAPQTTTSDDGIFTVTVGGATPSTSAVQGPTSGPNTGDAVSGPTPRMNAGMAVRKSVLYLYGGMVEDGDRQLTLADFYSLDLRKLDEWHTLIPNDMATQQWIESDSSDDEDSEGDGKDSEEESDEDSESDEEEDDMDTNEPV